MGVRGREEIGMNVPGLAVNVRGLAVHAQYGKMVSQTGPQHCTGQRLGTECSKPDCMVQILVDLPLNSCMTLDELVNLSVPSL